MKQYWENLQPRERRALIVGAVSLGLLLAYLLVWNPYQKEVSRLRQSVAQQREVLAYMQQAAVELAQLRGASATVRRPTPGRSLLTVVDGSAKASGLGSALKRVQPDGQNSVRVWLEHASFDDVLRWIDRLGSTEGIRVSGLVVEREEGAGRVSARVVLEGAG